MFFIILTFAAALFIEALGSLVSVIGISAIFGANLIIIALAVALDVGKIVTVSLLYTHWKRLSKLMKFYALLASAVTMIITSSGAAGYLSEQFQLAIQDTKVGNVKLDALTAQQQKYEARKKQIDDQIANLPTKTTVSNRLRLMKGFQAEQASLDAKIADIEKQLPDAQVKQIGTESKAGPILEIAKSFNIPVEQAVKYVIMLIISVFDPLAIFLIISGNFLWARRKEERARFLVHRSVEVEPIETSMAREMDEDDKLKRFDPEKHGGEFPNAETKKAMDEARTLAEWNAMQEEGQTGAVTLPDGTRVFPEMPDFLKDPITQPALLPKETFPTVNIDVPTATEEELERIRAEALKKKETEFWEEQHRLSQQRRAEFEAQAAAEPEEVTLPRGVLSPSSDDHLPRKRPQITKSSLGLIPADPTTIVDANEGQHGFRKAQVLTTPTKKS